MAPDAARHHPPPQRLVALAASRQTACGLDPRSCAAGRIESGSRVRRPRRARSTATASCIQRRRLLSARAEHAGADAELGQIAIATPTSASRVRGGGGGRAGCAPAAGRTADARPACRRSSRGNTSCAIEQVDGRCWGPRTSVSQRIPTPTSGPAVAHLHDPAAPKAKPACSTARAAARPARPTATARRRRSRPIRSTASGSTAQWPRAATLWPASPARSTSRAARSASVA
jgi:hypothetical protein